MSTPRLSLIDEMLDELPFSRQELVAIMRSAPRRYKVFQIEKRTPGEYRTISQPTPEVKLLQRWLIKKIEKKLPVHECATAYRRGIGILENASRHKSHRYLLKMDFRNFFPSISLDDVKRHLEGSVEIPGEELALISKLLCWRPKGQAGYFLAIGAPSSPLISNSAMYAFDCKLSEFCAGHKVGYSRYADDLTFSCHAPDMLSIIHKFVCGEALRVPYPKLEINHEKTTFLSKKFRREITGLIVSNEGSVSIGRDKKRLMRAQIDHYRRGNLSLEEVASLRGMIAFVLGVDREFIARLAKVYGDDVIQRILMH